MSRSSALIGLFAIFSAPVWAAFPDLASLKIKHASSQVQNYLSFTRCRAVISSNTVHPNHLPRELLADNSPILLLEHWGALVEAVRRENCLDFVLRLGHDCCGFMRAAVRAWRDTRVQAEGEITVLLEKNALVENCLGCLVQTALAQSLRVVKIFKQGRLLRRITTGLDLQGKTLKVSAIHYPPFITVPEGAFNKSQDITLDETEVALLDGVEFRILQHLSQKFNFRYELELRQEGELWGIVLENSTATGVVGKITDGQVQLGVGGFNWDMRYSGSHVDQLLPYRRTLVKFLSPRRERVENWLALVRPFSLEVWLAVVAVFSASAGCLYVTHRTETGRWDLFGSMLVALAAFSQQGDIPKFWLKGNRRAILVGLQMCIILLGASYSALLIAGLSVEERVQQIDTVEQLADSGLLYTDVDELWPGQLMLSEDPHVNDIMQRYEPSGSWIDLQLRLASLKFTYTAECLDTGFLCLQEPMDVDLLEKLHLSRDFVLASEIGMVLTKGFPLKPAFDQQVSLLFESGILKFWEKQVVSNFPDTSSLIMRREALDSFENSPVVFGISHLAGPFLLLVFGLCFSVVAFLLEISCS